MLVYYAGESVSEDGADALFTIIILKCQMHCYINDADVQINKDVIKTQVNLK